MDYSHAMSNFSSISSSLRVSGLRYLRNLRGFTLIELLIVIAIISVLAGLGFAGVNGALRSARKAEVRAMAAQVKLALTSYYSDYGVWPPKVTTTDQKFLQIMDGTDTANNKRGIRYLEVPPKFTGSGGLVTPKGFYPDGKQQNYTVVIDTDYNGKIRLPGQSGDVSGSVAVYVPDPTAEGKYIGTW